MFTVRIGTVHNAAYFQYHDRSLHEVIFTLSLNPDQVKAVTALKVNARFKLQRGDAVYTIIRKKD